MRVNILLACTECKRRNYATVKNKKNTTGRSPKPDVGGSNPSWPAISFVFSGLRLT